MKNAEFIKAAQGKIDQCGKSIMYFSHQYHLSKEDREDLCQQAYRHTEEYISGLIDAYIITMTVNDFRLDTFRKLTGLRKLMSNAWFNYKCR